MFTGFQAVVHDPVADLELHGQFVDDLHAHGERHAVLYLDADPVLVAIAEPLGYHPFGNRRLTEQEEEDVIHQQQSQEYKEHEPGIGKEFGQQESGHE